MRGHGMTMSDSERRVRSALPIANAVAAVLVSAGLLVLFGIGGGGLPPLGRLLVPGHGAWAWQFLLIPIGPLGLLP
jgi:hypothetical protein